MFYCCFKWIVKRAKGECVSDENKYKDIDLYQIETRRTAGKSKTKEMETCLLCMGLTGEAGEVADYMKKIIGHRT